MKGPHVPVVPNASLVTGIVKAAQEHPDPIIELLVRQAEDIDDLANFCEDEIGNTISITLRGKRERPLPFRHQSIRLQVEFRGSAWRGGYYAKIEDVQILDHDDTDTLESENDD